MVEPQLPRRATEPSAVVEVANIVLPALVADVFGLGALALIGTTAGAIVSVGENRLLRARVLALEEHVARIGRLAAERHAIAPDELRAALTRPDIAYLVALARQHYAVATMRGRLERLAAVVAGRIPARDTDDFEPTQRFAEAALELPDVAVAFLDLLVRRADAGEPLDGKKEGPIEERPVAGETHLMQFIKARSWAAAADVNSAAAAANALVTHGFALHAVGMFGGIIDAVTCADGGIARYADHTFAPTDLGRGFIDQVRGHGEASQRHEVVSGASAAKAS